MDRVNPESVVVEFGRFRLLPQRRLLEADGVLVELGGRAIDVLVALVAQPGAILSHAELLRRAWPGQVVEENNLQVQISALRKALGSDRQLIRTVVGRGYQFVGVASAVVEPETLAPRNSNLPAPMTDLIGRQGQLRDAAELLRSARLLTLIGAGGVGKTRFGLALARELLPEFPGGVWWIDLARLAPDEEVIGSVAAALGLPVAGAQPALAAVLVALLAALGRKQVLLVLDNCEHVIAPVTALAEAVLGGCAGARLLVTSREPLHTEGESWYRLPPLELPAPDSGAIAPAGQVLPAEGAAVQLFMARARRIEPRFAPDAHDLALVGAICRRLDGVPLAIELAAARAPALGLERLASGVDELLQLLVGGHRTALPRHQTYRATLDWSYTLLPQRERIILRRLAVFGARFTLEAALALVSRTGLPGGDVVDGITSLVAKSLLVVEEGAGARRYRLLDTVRAYARAKLRERGEHQQLARQHAVYIHEQLAPEQADALAAPARMAHYRQLQDDVQAALDWAFAAHGDLALGVQLAAAALPLWLHLSLTDEALRQAQRALAHAGDDQHSALRLQAALALIPMFGLGGTRRGGEPGWREVHDLAETLGDRAGQLGALWGVWLGKLHQGDLAAGMQLAERYVALAGAGVAQGEHLLGHTLHLLGDQPRARRHLERMLEQSAGLPALANRQIGWYGVEQQVAARADLALVQWLQGQPERAARTAAANVAQAQAGGHALTLCHALVTSACPVALLTGDLASLRQYVRLLVVQAGEHGLHQALAIGQFFDGMLRVRSGELAAGARQLHAARAALRQSGDALLYTSTLAWFALAMAETGDINEAVSAIDEALRRASHCPDCWGNAEMLRVKGELLLLQGGSQRRAQAEDHFGQALEVAAAQGALGFELRAATSLARLLADDGQAETARAVLGSVVARCVEGRQQPDLRLADALLAQLPVDHS